MKHIYQAGQNLKENDFIVISPEDGKIYKATPRDIAKQHDVLEQSPVEEKYLIWSIEHSAWWCPAENGYTLEKAKAGVYSYERACEIVESANINNLDVPNEAMIKIC